MSAKFNPEALTRINTSPGVGVGSGFSWTLSTLMSPVVVVTTCLIGRVCIRLIEVSQTLPIVDCPLPIDPIHETSIGNQKSAIGNVLLLFFAANFIGGAR